MWRVGVAFVITAVLAVVGLVVLIEEDRHPSTKICVEVATHRRVPMSSCNPQAAGSPPRYAPWYVFGDVPKVGAVVSGGGSTPTTSPDRFPP